MAGIAAISTGLAGGAAGATAAGADWLEGVAVVVEGAAGGATRLPEARGAVLELLLVAALARP